MLKQWGLLIEKRVVQGTACLRVKRESLSRRADGGDSGRSETLASSEMRHEPWFRRRRRRIRISWECCNASAFCKG